MNNFWEEQLSPGYYDNIVTTGVKNKRGIQACWHILTYKKVAKYINDSSNHLDYACGPGTLIGQFTNANSIGVDLSSNQINYAIEKYGTKGNFITIDNYDLSKQINKFEIVTILGLFEYLDDNDILILLDKIYDSLKEGGKLIVTTPNYGGSMYFIDKALNLFGPVNYNLQNINKFSSKRLVNLIDKSKFSSFKISKFNNIFLFLSFLNLELGQIYEKYFARLTKNKFGLLLFLDLTK